MMEQEKEGDEADCVGEQNVYSCVCEREGERVSDRGEVLVHV